MFEGTFARSEQPDGKNELFISKYRLVREDHFSNYLCGGHYAS